MNFEKFNVHPDQVVFDENRDGIAEAVINRSNLAGPTSLLTGEMLAINGSGTASGLKIQVTPELLYRLSRTLENIANNELAEIMSHVELMKNHNENVGSKYTSRILQSTEGIEMLLQQLGLTKLVRDAVAGYGRLVNEQSKIQAGRDLPSATALNSFLSGLFSGAVTFADNLQSLACEMGELDRDLRDFHYTTTTNPGGSNYTYFSTTVSDTPIALLGELKTYIEKMPLMVENEFKGDGNRSGFKDGLQQAFQEVFNVQMNNLKQIQEAVQSAAAITLAIAKNFENRDTVVAQGINNKEIPSVESLQTIPNTYEAYLKNYDIFDDVKDVICAWENQIDRASQNIENYLIDDIRGIMYKHKAKHDRVFDSVTRGSTLCDKLIEELSNDIQELRTYKRPATYSYYGGNNGGASNSEETVTETRWVNRGTIESNMSDEEKSTIYKVNELLKVAEQKLLGLSGSIKEFESNLTTGNSKLDIVLRQQIYSTTDIDEIVNTQYIDKDIMKAMILEFSDANNVILSQQKGTAINALSEVFQYIIKLLQYYQTLTEDCFG